MSLTKVSFSMIQGAEAVDTSFLVATLTAAIQELNTLVTNQAAEIAALKSKVGA